MFALNLAPTAVRGTRLRCTMVPGFQAELYVPFQSCSSMLLATSPRVNGWRHPVRADYSSSSLYLWYYPVPLVMIRQA